VSTVPRVAFPPAAGRWIGERAGTLLVLALVAVVILCHPLSPLLLCGWLVALVVAGRWRLWWLPVVAGLGTLAWTFEAHEWLSMHTHLFDQLGEATKNAAGTSGVTPGTPQHQLVTAAARYLSLGIWALAGLGLISRLRSGADGRYRTLTLALLAAAPFPAIAAQSYGGEMIYRVYLFTLPWCALLVASLLIGPRAWFRPARAVLVAGVLLVVAGLFVVAEFGLDRSNRVLPQEVAASTWFEEHAPSGSMLAELAGNFPAEVTARYTDFQSPWGTTGTSVIDGDPQFNGRELTEQDIPAMIDYLNEFGAGQVYIALSPGQEAYASAFGQAPPGAVDRFADILRHSDRFETVFQDGPVTVLRLRQTPDANAPAG
jgi:hypothetical protein